MHFVNFSKHGDGGFDNAIRFEAIERTEKEGRLSGTDPFDGSPCEYIHAGGDLREGLFSSVSRSIQRQRTLGAGLSKYLFDAPGRTLAECCTYINEHRLHLYTAEANSAIFEFLKSHIDPALFYCSEYFGQEHRPGQLVGNIPHEDLQQLSFPDHFFDIVLTAEVMEHVPDAPRAEREIMRVLKPGGGYIFTVPYLAYERFDNVRAVVENGKIRYLEEPQYHGDPMRPKEGILVYRIFSEGELHTRFMQSGAAFSTYNMYDETAGIISADAFVHVVVKDAVPLNVSIVRRNIPFRSFIYTHIPKCAGTSFREYVSKAGLANGVSADKIHVPGTGGLGNDKNISQLTKQELLHFRNSEKLVLADHSMFNVHLEYKLKMQTPYYYVILREPIERFLSHYNFFYRHLNYWGLKGVHLNDLKRETYIELLLRMSNVQLYYCMNPKYQALTAPFGEQVRRYGRQFIRTITFGKCFKAVPWGVKADETWLKEGLKNLEENYGSFGIMENMEASLRLLEATSPAWLSFPKVKFPDKNRGFEFVEDEPVNEETLAVFRKYNAFDLKFYERALDMFDRKLGEHC